MKDLILDPGKTGKTKNLYLFLNGWIFPTDASINVAISQSANLKVVPPVIQVINKKVNGKLYLITLAFQWERIKL